VRFLDTNILLYSISTAPEEVRKRDIAIDLLASDDLALSVQVLQEFYVQATRATRTDPLDQGVAAGLIRTWLRFSVQDITLAVMLDAFNLKARYQVSYWDAAIVSAARALGCREVLSGDLSHGQTIEGILITDPFRKP
jgi:predicted nucleic acid-binding protein